MTRSFGANARARTLSSTEADSESTQRVEELKIYQGESEMRKKPCPMTNTESEMSEHAKAAREAPNQPKSVIWLSREECEAQNQRRAKALYRSRPRTIRAAMKLQRRIVTCTEAERCGSAACVTCTHVVREQFISAATSFFSADHGNLIPVAITIIPANERVSYRRMERWKLTDFVRRMKARLNRISPALLAAAAGAVDISLNRDRRKRPKHQRYRAHYVPHLHLAGLTADPKQLGRELRALFPADPVHAKRPERVQELTPDEYAVSYFMRLEFDRRTHKTTEDGNSVMQKAPLRTGKRSSATGKRYTELQPVLLAIGKNSPMHRAFFFRCRPILDGPSAPAITLIQSPVHTRSPKPTRLRHDQVYPTRRVKR